MTPPFILSRCITVAAAAAVMSWAPSRISVAQAAETAPSPSQSKMDAKIMQLQKTDTTVGTGAEAFQGKTAVVHYTGWLYDPTATDKKGRKFDSSLDRGLTVQFSHRRRPRHPGLGRRCRRHARRWPAYAGHSLGYGLWQPGGGRGDPAGRNPPVRNRAAATSSSASLAGGFAAALPFRVMECPAAVVNRTSTGRPLGEPASRCPKDPPYRGAGGKQEPFGAAMFRLRAESTNTSRG